MRFQAKSSFFLPTAHIHLQRGRASGQSWSRRRRARSGAEILRWPLRPAPTPGSGHQHGEASFSHSYFSTLWPPAAAATAG